MKSPALVLMVVLCGVADPGASGAQGASGAAEGAQVTVALKIDQLNRTYSDFMPPLEGLEERGVSVRLTSPSQTLVLRDHLIRLTPNPDGSFNTELELEFHGNGSIVADISLGPAERQIPDQVVVPLQKILLAGRIRLDREAGGYRVTALELPDHIRVAVQSPTANQILALCDNAAMLTLGAVDCGGLEQALTHPAVPIPAGQSFRLEDGDLSDENRRQLEALLAIF